MRTWMSFVFSLFVIAGCSDHGTDLGKGWTRYNLPHGSIALPDELTQTNAGVSGHDNPEFAGDVQNQAMRVQFYLNRPLAESAFRQYTYEEETIMLHGRKVVLFRGIGVFHYYDSSFGRLVGAKAYFGNSAEPIVVAVCILQPEAEPLARAILLTLHP